MSRQLAGSNLKSAGMISQFLLVLGCAVVLGALYLDTRDAGFWIMVVGLVCTFVGAILDWRIKD
jgi:hypothetical protein